MDVASERKRNRIAKMRNVIAQRAGTALDHSYPGPHRDKRIARDFSVSVRMAQHLRAGQHWTLDRLAQASTLIGAAFDRALYSPVSSAQHFSELGELIERLAQLEAWREEVDRGGDAGLAPLADASRVAGSRGGIGGRAEGFERAGATAPDRRGDVAGTVRESRRDVADRDPDGSAR